MVLVGPLAGSTTTIATPFTLSRFERWSGAVALKHSAQFVLNSVVSSQSGASLVLGNASVVANINASSLLTLNATGTIEPSLLECELNER